MQMIVRQRVLMNIYGYLPLRNPFDTVAKSSYHSDIPLEILAEAREELFWCVNDTLRLVREARVAETQHLLREMIDCLVIDQGIVSERLRTWNYEF